MAVAPPPPPPLSPSPDRSEDAAALFLVGLLLELRVELQDLQRSVAELRRAVENPLATPAALEAATDRAASIFDVDRAQVAQLLDHVRAVLDAAPGEYARIGDEVGFVANAFDRVAMEWPRGRVSGASLAPTIAALNELLDESIYHIALVTTPKRLNDHLRHLPIGQALDFAAAFGDELPNPEQRRRVLEYLATHPIGIEGLVDVEKGKIYRKASSRWVRVATLLVPPAVLLAGVGLAWILTSLDDWGLVGSDWPDGLSTFGPVLSAYVFVTVGALAHVAVSFLKRSRESGGEPLVVAGFFWWLHVRWASVSLSVLWLWIAVLGLAIADQLSWLTAFLAGYGIDSVADLFLQRFEARASKGAESLKKAFS
jgi:hypothetical protein